MSTLDQNLRTAIHEHLGTQACLIDESITARMNRIQHADQSETITLDEKPIMRFWPPEFRYEGNKVICNQRFARFSRSPGINEESR